MSQKRAIQATFTTTNRDHKTEASSWWHGSCYHHLSSIEFWASPRVIPRDFAGVTGETESLTRPSTLKTSQMRPAWDTMFSRTSWNSSWNFEGRSEAGIKNGTQSVRGKKHQMEHN